MSGMDAVELALEETLWDALKHPRGRGGRWRETFNTPHTTPHLEKFAAKLEPLPVGRKQIASPTVTPAFRRARQRLSYTAEFGRHGDEFTYDLAVDYGIAGKPHVVSPERLDAEIVNGAIEMYRGQTDVTYAEAFTTGPAFYGQGFRGNGIYFAHGERASTMARQYAQAPPTRGIAAKVDKPTVIRAALHPDAKIVEYDEIAGRAKADHVRLKSSNEMGDPGTGPAPKEAVLAAIARDPARYAITQGYDAIRVNEWEMIVLNRSAVLVSKEFEDAGTNVVSRSRVASE
jgi:hypothetical protein